jgi:Maf-like protein
MLESHSNSTHLVYTGVCLVHIGTGKIVAEFVVSTQVQFRELSSNDIEAYLAIQEHTDKAGAYGIQGRAAGFVKKIVGSYTNVMGLPLAEVLETLSQVSIQAFPTSKTHQNPSLQSKIQAWTTVQKKVTDVCLAANRADFGSFKRTWVPKYF